MNKFFTGDDLDYTNVKHFVILSYDIAKENSKTISRRRPRSERKRFARNQFNSWKQKFETILENAKTEVVEGIIDDFKALPLDAVKVCNSFNEANDITDHISQQLSGGKYGVGIENYLIGTDLAIIELWVDC